MIVELLTIAEIAKRLNMPESTVRYYRDKFAAFIPEVGEGRNRRYRPESLELFKYVAEELRSGKTVEMVLASMPQRFAINAIEPAADHNNNSTEMILEFMRFFAEQQNKAVMTELEQLRNEVAASRQDNVRLLENLDKRDQTLMETLRTLQDSKKKKGFFKRLFD